MCTLTVFSLCVHLAVVWANHFMTIIQWNSMKASSSSFFFSSVWQMWRRQLSKVWRNSIQMFYLHWKSTRHFANMLKKLQKGVYALMWFLVRYGISFHFTYLFPLSLGTKISSMVPPFLGRYCLEFYEKDAWYFAAPDRSTAEGMGFVHPWRWKYDLRRASEWSNSNSEN